MAIVDTHAHIYSEDTETYPQSPEPFLPPSGRGTIADLKNEVKTNNIDRVVVSSKPSLCTNTITGSQWIPCGQTKNGQPAF